MPETPAFEYNVENLIDAFNRGDDAHGTLFRLLEFTLALGLVDTDVDLHLRAALTSLSHACGAIDRRIGYLRAEGK